MGNISWTQPEQPEINKYNLPISIEPLKYLEWIISSQKKDPITISNTPYLPQTRPAHLYFHLGMAYCCGYYTFGKNAIHTKNLTLALIPRSVGQSVGLSILQKLQKKIQNFTKHWNKEFPSPRFQKGRLSRKLRQYAGASLTESSFF